MDRRIVYRIRLFIPRNFLERREERKKWKRKRAKIKRNVDTNTISKRVVPRNSYT